MSSAHPVNQHHHPQPHRLQAFPNDIVSNPQFPQFPVSSSIQAADSLLSQKKSLQSFSIEESESLRKVESSLDQNEESNDTSDSKFLNLSIPTSSSHTFPNLFADVFSSTDHPDKRRDTLALPKIEPTSATLTTSVTTALTGGETGTDPSSSRSSSPYVSPSLPPRLRQGGMGSMGEITLPPLSSAVPMRRGAVSGASSGPSLPFPPIRLLSNEEDVPSRGPSPTLGKRPSFSLGHSNHVPPGPDIHLPPPSLVGSAERRPTLPTNGTTPSAALASLQVPSNYPPHSAASVGSGEGTDYSRSGAIRMSDDGAGYYYANSVANPAGAPRSTSGSAWGAPEGAYGAHTNMNNPRSSHYAEDPYYGSHHSQASVVGGHASMHPANRYGSGMSNGPGPDIYGRYEQHDNSNSFGMVSRQMGYGLSMGPDDHLMSINGKRPRSAPRVLSSQPRIFACSQCPARFARNHDLKRHQRGHLSVRPYPCTWCGKSFSRKDALKRHVLVKKCGKDKKNNGSGGNGNGGGNDDGHDGNVRKSGNSRGGEDGRPDHSRSDATGDRENDESYGGDRGDDDDHSDFEGEDRSMTAASSNTSFRSPDNSSNASMHNQRFFPYTNEQSRSSSQHNNIYSSQSMKYDQKHDTHSQSLYRWNHKSNVPSLATQAAASMRAGDFTGAATSLVGFAATRRPSASIA